MESASWLQLYMRVVVMRGGRKPGTIRFIGETEFGPGTWVGVELDAPQGNNSGTIDVGSQFPVVAAAAAVIVPFCACRASRTSTALPITAYS
jgi:dynactin complex subunit